MNPVDRFADLAKHFCAWAEHEPAGTEAEETRAVLQMVAELYAAALTLPEGEAPEGEGESTAQEEWLRIYRRCASLPIDMYDSVLDPLELVDAATGVGSIGDDLADIHRDLRRGLHWYEEGRAANAAWDWSFHFRVHWGRHATGALSALHAWWSGKPFTDGA